VKRLSQERPKVQDLRVVYADLDGTVLGPGGSLFAGPDERVSLRAAGALRALHEASVPFVIVSGRTRRGLGEVARVLGAAAYIAEMGALIVEREPPEETLVRNFGAFEGEGDPAQAIARSGAGAFLLERFPRRAEPIAPWAEAMLMLQGWIDPAEANEALLAAGYGWLELHDNGKMRRQLPHLEVDEVHALHLLPKGVDKASAVALHRKHHAIPAESAIAVGDSPSDLKVAREVGAFFLVANGVASVSEEDVPDNVYLTSGAHGDGFAEAIEAVLAR
jgi:hydroxymethylpyrimidine pyrophosphatase-like HAD family hydrolase